MADSEKKSSISPCRTPQNNDDPGSGEITCPSDLNICHQQIDISHSTSIKDSDGCAVLITDDMDVNAFQESLMNPNDSRDSNATGVATDDMTESMMQSIPALDEECFKAADAVDATKIKNGQQVVATDEVIEAYSESLRNVKNVELNSHKVEDHVSVSFPTISLVENERCSVVDELVDEDKCDPDRTEKQNKCLSKADNLQTSDFLTDLPLVDVAATAGGLETIDTVVSIPIAKSDYTDAEISISGSVVSQSTSVVPFVLVEGLEVSNRAHSVTDATIEAEMDHSFSSAEGVANIETTTTKELILNEPVALASMLTDADLILEDIAMPQNCQASNITDGSDVADATNTLLCAEQNTVQSSTISEVISATSCHDSFTQKTPGNDGDSARNDADNFAAEKLLGSESGFGDHVAESHPGVRENNEIEIQSILPASGAAGDIEGNQTTDTRAAAVLTNDHLQGTSQPIAELLPVITDSGEMSSKSCAISAVTVGTTPVAVATVDEIDMKPDVDSNGVVVIPEVHQRTSVTSTLTSEASEDEARRSVRNAAKESLTDAVKEEPKIVDAKNDTMPTAAATRMPSATKTPSSTVKQQECVVCHKVTKCKYNIVRNGDTKHLCEDTCFSVFRAQPTAYLQTTSTSPSVTSSPSVPLFMSPSVVIPPISANISSVEPPSPEAQSPTATKEGQLYLCHICLKTIYPAANKKILAVKIGGADGKTVRFCRQKCLDDYAAQRVPCTVCERNCRTCPQHLTDAGKNFCSTICQGTYKKSSASAKIATSPTVRLASPLIGRVPPQPASSSTTAVTGNCSVCNKKNAIKHEVNFNGKIHKLCSDGCFAAFRIANKLGMNTCDNCDKSFPFTGPDGAATIQLEFDGHGKKFCTLVCQDQFKARNQRMVICTWCNGRKSIFDVVDRVDAMGVRQVFCSLNCLSLYRVNLQANSNMNVICDQCHKTTSAQYHLTMSDASVRNFCGYNCVMAFQAQFTQPSTNNSVGGGQPQQQPPVSQPTPSLQVTANTASNKQQLQTPTNTTATRQSARATAKGSSKTSAPTSSTHPIISNVVSLATSTQADSVDLLDEPVNNENMPPLNYQPQQIIIQPPMPKEMRNKALLCKPFMQTKATSCRPSAITKSQQTTPPPTISTGTQTDEWQPRKCIVPVPVPVFIPAPLAAYWAPTPFPLAFPVPIPVPCFIPTTKKSTESIMKKIKEIQERMPSDPYEAELLMMAEAVANAGKSYNSDSDTDIEDNAEQFFGGVNSLGGMNGNQTANNSYAEDMLQMALRLAAEMPEPEPEIPQMAHITHGGRAAVTVDTPSLVDYSSISTDNDTSYDSTPQRGGRGGGRGKRPRGRGRGAGSGSKRARVDEDQEQEQVSAVEQLQQYSTPQQQQHAPQQRQQTVPLQLQQQQQQPAANDKPADADNVLKFTYGVNAYRHWALQKNASIEANISGSGRAGAAALSRLKLFKLDVLQCTADELNHSLCLFVKEVKKPNGEEYAPDSIYYLCLGIQEYIYENGRIDNIFTDLFYERFTDCLNDVLSSYEVRLNSQGLLVCRIEEEHLWESKQLGAHSPHVLLNTLVYFNTKQFMLRTPDEHLGLSFSHIMKHWRKTNLPNGKQGRTIYLRYYPPAPPGPDGAKDSAKRKKDTETSAIFEQCENAENPLRCPVKLYEFYLSKCPESIKTRNDVFYLVPERSCVPDSPVWYSTQNLGSPAMTKMLNRLNTVREIQESQLGSMQTFYG